MFKNPLKYQKGGTVASQEQLVQLFQAAAENAQVDPQQLVQKASEIGQDEEAVAQFMQGLQLCAQGDPEGIKFIKSLFQNQAFKKGGKIFEFICKHKKGGYVSGCGCSQEGGKVEKHQDSNGVIGVTNGKYQASDWKNEFNQFTPTPGGGYARNYRLPMFGGHRWGIPGNTLRQVLITYDKNGIPRKAVRDLEGYYGNGRIDTVFYDARGNNRNSRDFETRVNRELAGMDPHQRPMEKEKCGGKVKK